MVSAQSTTLYFRFRPPVVDATVVLNCDTMFLNAYEGLINLPLVVSFLYMSVDSNRFHVVQ